MHLGKGATFRAAGVPVPEVIHADLAVLDRLIARFAALRLVIAGDLLHAATGRSETLFGPLSEWRARHIDLDVVIVRGNHDRRAGDPPESCGLRIVDEPHADGPDDGPLAFAHHPDVGDRGAAAGVLCGHLHPCAVLGDGFSSLRAPCFWVGRTELVLPAFGRFTGCRSIRPRRGDRVFVLGAGQVAEARTAA
jgi:DNA ligase-associated metallophosphoesterase